MKTLVVTALFPPDVSEPARYTKRLVSQLPGEVAVLHFGTKPESAAKAKFISISKRRGRISRFISFTKKLFGLIPEYDVLIIQNGPSVELSSLLVSLFRPKSTLFIISDRPAHERTNKALISKIVHKALRAKCNVIESDTLPPKRPLIHPLTSYPAKEMHVFEQAWDEHTKNILDLTSRIV